MGPLITKYEVAVEQLPGYRILKTGTVMDVGDAFEALSAKARRKAIG